MNDDGFTLSCPVPAPAGETIQLAQGSGGRAMERLLDTLIRPAFRNPLLDRRHDGARLELTGPLAFTTDSYVVQPLFFPGGDIGTLAVNGTVNDLAMCGARPAYLSASFILEEGLPVETLRRVVHSMRDAAMAARVEIVTGDLKVVDRGKADGLFVNTAGIGRIVARQPIEPQSVREGDVVIVSGDLARHGIAVMATREGLGFESAIASDCAAIAEPVMAMIDAGFAVHCLRDLTRGGLASALVEIAETAGIGLDIDEPAVPVREDVRSACELLGLDPLHVANEGRFVAFLPEAEAAAALRELARFPVSEAATVIGRAGRRDGRRVTCTSAIGGRRVLDMLAGDQLPRIC
jgi:hydrogenase expression/formation protein HypE